MQNRKPTSTNECKVALKFLDYLRKSQCTPTHSGWKTGPQVDDRNGCQKVLKTMKDVAEKCLEDEFKDDEPVRGFGM